jgi:hypothetical protein
MKSPLTAIAMAFVLLAGCGSSGSSSGRCANDVQLQAALYHVLGPGVESTQVAGTIHYGVDGVFEANFVGPASSASPNAEFTGTGKWSWAKNIRSEWILSVDALSWSVWKGSIDAPPTVLSSREAEASSNCQFMGQLTGRTAQSGYWLMIPSD